MDSEEKGAEIGIERWVRQVFNWTRGRVDHFIYCGGWVSELVDWEGGGKGDVRAARNFQVPDARLVYARLWIV